MTAFFASAWIGLAVILVVAPDIYDRTLLWDGSRRLEDGAFLLVLTALIVLLEVGVMRRWRWAFWLILLAFLAGVLRVPASLLEIAGVGVVSPTGPTWYAVLQGAIGIVQFAIGLVMVTGCRRTGVWGDP